MILDPSNTQHKFRLAGIDCPERKQPWSTRAKQALSDNVFDRQVVVDWEKHDRYKRIVGKVLDGQRDVNLGRGKGAFGQTWSRCRRGSGEGDEPASPIR